MLDSVLNLFKRHSHKMVKHTQTIRRQSQPLSGLPVSNFHLFDHTFHLSSMSIYVMLVTDTTTYLKMTSESVLLLLLRFLQPLCSKSKVIKKNIVLLCIIFCV